MVAQRSCLKVFKVLNVCIFIILTVLAVYLSDEILVQYATKDTSFSQSEIPVTEEDSPTIFFFKNKSHRIFRYDKFKVIKTKTFQK